MKECKQGELAVLSFFNGTSHLLITGQGEVELWKSIDGKQSFYPVTDTAGDKVTFSSEEEDVIFNSEIENKSQTVHYAIKCLSGEVKYEVAR